MRILHVTRNLEVGGLERLVVDLAAEQVRAGHNSTIVEVCNSTGERIAPSDDVSRRTSSLWRVLRMARPDVVHAHNTLALRRSILPCMVMRIPLVMTKHGMSFSEGIRSLAYQCPKHVACVSEEIHQRLVKVVPSMQRRSSVVYNGVSIDSIAVSDRDQARKVLGLTPGCKAFVWVGRLAPEKGLDTLIEAAVRCRQYSAWKLFLIGEGVLRKALSDHVSRFGMQDRIFFMGNRNDVRDYLHAFDVFVMPSLTEGLPMALLEAAAARLPLLVSDVGAMPRVVRNQNGWVLPPGDLEALASLMGEVCQFDRVLLQRMGARSMDVVRTLYSISVCAQEYLNLYHRALHRTMGGVGAIAR